MTKELQATYTIFQCIDCGWVYGQMSFGDPPGTIDPCPNCLSVLGSYRIQRSHFDFHREKMNQEGKQLLDKEIKKLEGFSEHD